MAAVRTAAIALGLCVAACGDNQSFPPVAPPLAQADAMFIVAHFDDDEIFMQPELLAALAAGSVTTVFVTSGDQVKGDAHADATFGAARIAYSSVLGTHDWHCGYLFLGDAPIHHCRMGSVSLIGLDLPDGGITGAMPTDLLHLVEGREQNVPILGPVRGRATEDDIITELAQLITITAPLQLNAQDVGATHGRDHSSHLMTASFALWAAARAGYTGELRWHRGYNVVAEQANFDDPTATSMLSHFEACYLGCGPCGGTCAKMDPTELSWMQHQYSFDRVRFATLDAGLALGEDGHLFSGELCMTSASDGTAALAPCTNAPEQYWLLDSEGHLWNGSPPAPVADMDYDHVRCLSTLATAPTCGATNGAPTWAFR